MKLKNLKENDVFYFDDDNSETELVVIYEDELIIQFDTISSLNDTSLRINKEWGYLGERNVQKLYNKKLLVRDCNHYFLPFKLKHHTSKICLGCGIKEENILKLG